MPLAQVQSTDLPPPELDFIEFTFQGVTFRVFGVLHGVTGGMNREYRQFVRRHIRAAPVPKLGEKGMKVLYRGCGVEQEMEDWLVLRASDCFFMGLQLVLDPRCLRMITLDALGEMLRLRDPFVAHQRRCVSDLGESPYFHYLNPDERRGLIGFPPPLEGLQRDLGLLSRPWASFLPRRAPSKVQNAKWRRILLLSRFMHIPCRSLHMLHFAAAYAKRRGLSMVSLFVGETHNTDMLAFAAEGDGIAQLLSPGERRFFDIIVRRAERFGGDPSFCVRGQLALLKLRYVLTIAAGACAGAALYLCAALRLVP
jgi:hypothetical protein